jgi:hypothetical protein
MVSQKDVAELSVMLKAEEKRIGVKEGPRFVWDARLPHITTCDGMRAVDHFGRLAVEIEHGWNTSRHDAASVLKVLAGYADGAAPSFADVYDAIADLRVAT